MNTVSRLITCCCLLTANAAASEVSNYSAPPGPVASSTRPDNSATQQLSSLVQSQAALRFSAAGQSVELHLRHNDRVSGIQLAFTF